MKLRRIASQNGWYEIMGMCPICGQNGWCAINDKQTIVNCMRVASDTYHDSIVGRSFKHYLNPDDAGKFEVEINDHQSLEKKPAPHLDRVYRSLMQVLPLSYMHKTHLINDRFFLPDTIVSRGYRTMPSHDRHKVAKELIENLGDQQELLGVPGFFVKEGKFGAYWTMAGVSGILVPFRSIQNEILGWQIRVDKRRLELKMKGAIKGEIIKEIEPNEQGVRQALCKLVIQGKDYEQILVLKDKKICQSHGRFVFDVELTEGPRYYWWSSGSKPNGTIAGSPLPYHCSVPTPVMKYWTVGSQIEEHIDCSEVWVTEGALKGDKAADVLAKPVFSLPGVGSYPLILDPLKKIGCKHVILAFDADAVVTEEVERALSLCAEYFAANTDMKLSLAIWDIKLGKGLDDLFDNGFHPIITNLL